MLLLGTKIKQLPQKLTICYNTWYVHQVLTFQIFVEENLVANKIDEIIWDGVRFMHEKEEGDTSKSKMQWI